MCGPEDTEPPKVPYRTPHFLLAGAGADGDYVLKEFPIDFNGYTYTSWIAYRVGAPPKPVVLVMPNYAGLKQFDKDQAMFLAKLGFVGLAVDLYKEVPGYMFEDRNPVLKGTEGSESAGVTAKNIKEVPGLDEAFATGGPFDDLQMQTIVHFQKAFAHYHGSLKEKGAWRNLMKANLTQAKAHPSVHPDFAAAIGYCFGGQCVLEMVRAGYDLQGVVSFHGILQSEPLNILADPNFDGTVNMAGVVNNYNTKCAVLIENAELDDHVTPESIADFQKEMNDNKIDWQIHHHAQTKHGWALPSGVWATEYHEISDRRSTNAMISLFADIFPNFPINPVECNAAGTRLGRVIVPSSAVYASPASSSPGPVEHRVISALLDQVDEMKTSKA